MKRKIVIYTVIMSMLAGIIIFYSLIIRPWQLTWGATPEEAASIMPGDEYLSSPDFNATRAITINANADEIWPWLVQIGDSRGGWYSYDFLDNHGKPSAKKIIPKFQHLAIGDKLSKGFWVKDFRKDKWILLEGKGPQGKMTWLMMLTPVDNNTTRYITRLRVQWYDSNLPQRLARIVFDTGEILMMRKSMLGIKKRAEGLVNELTDVNSEKFFVTKFMDWLVK